MAINSPQVYCTIASRVYICIAIAIPAIVLCINRRLYLLASLNSILSSEADKRREIMIDIAIGIGLPIIIMIFCMSYYYPSVSFTHLYYSIFRPELSIYNS